jgi:hypothetical protein
MTSGVWPPRSSSMQDLTIPASALSRDRRAGTNPIPQGLVAAVGLAGSLSVHSLLDREGRPDCSVATVNAEQLARDGFPVSVSNQSAYVYALVGS